MSRYFTQLARHTGLDASAPARNGRAATPVSAPLEQVSETVAPTNNSVIVATAPVVQPAKPPVVAQPSEPPVDVSQPRMLPAPLQTATETLPQAAPESRAGALEQTIIARTSAVAAPPASANRQTQPSDHTPAQAIAAPIAPNLPASIDLPVSIDTGAAPPQEIFLATSALLERGSPAAPEVLQQIYLREVRKWVANSPAQASEIAPPGLFPNVLSGLFPSAPSETAPPDLFSSASSEGSLGTPPRLETDFETPAPPEVKATEKARPRVPTPVVEEQEYVISIGSINVTLDAPPIPPPAAPQTAPPAEHPSASLRRYYL